MKCFVRHYCKLVLVEPAILAAATLLVTSVTKRAIDYCLISVGFLSVFCSSICEMSVNLEAHFGENLSARGSESCSESSNATCYSGSENI